MELKWNRYRSSGRLCQMASMALRHAAALAVIGWYLMVHPVVSGGGTIYADRSVPLARWKIGSTYDTEQQFLDAKAEAVEAAKREQGEAEAYALEAAYYSECIVSDDPRLKAK
jgi:hypothetical protein